MNIQEQYNKLLETRKTLPLDLINIKQRRILEHFRKMIPVHNIEQNMKKQFRFFYAPLKQIKGTNMICWPLLDGSIEIYMDKDFGYYNYETAIMQTTHEVLHGLSQIKDNIQYFFGHQYEGNDTYPIYNGIDEATTQLFTEDIEYKRLKEDVNYLYFITNIMRVMKVIFGVDKLANQYFNNNNQFEQEFNKLTNGKFCSFVILINDIYMLSKNKHYGEISNESLQLLTIKKEQLLNFTTILVEIVSKNNPRLIQEIIKEVKDEDLLSKMDIKLDKVKKY